ncbi:hypothetical protein M441DRAFT_226875 [Trichoderma asperellum CBS 433.97]|uniref:Uncharacterized protein n=1 Tax=Trichoderma asperellum (strain ATCC 204424 / CBS 433.97 / NBRC 101777) TaxID=1042311 RepID=A0A2T3ZQ22_TRIA4|nr:hypothetical protein M441DRAFT_226875 [Trichoderma asperellum CBS 433.97]PTB46907.1 hypothetical protein M441DRAFT_226875 [Trichoderma asperellum CBS 433.97]
MAMMCMFACLRRSNCEHGRYLAAEIDSLIALVSPYRDEMPSAKRKDMPPQLENTLVHSRGRKTLRCHVQAHQQMRRYLSIHCPPADSNCIFTLAPESHKLPPIPIPKLHDVPTRRLHVSSGSTNARLHNMGPPKTSDVIKAKI